MATVTAYFTESAPEGLKKVYAGVTLSSNYQRGGEALSAANFSLNGLITILPQSCANGYSFQWDNAAAKMIAFGLTNVLSTNGVPLIECQAATNFTGCVLPVVAIGYGTY